jgi:hypothetical protein
MIAFFCSSWERAGKLASLLTTVTAEVDGPYRLYIGRLHRNPARVYTVEQGAASAYAAGRLAARRGCSVHVTFADILCADADDLPLGSIHHLGKVYDLEGLTPLLSLLPESATEPPLPLDDLLPAEPVLATPEQEGWACGTLPWMARNAWLLDELEKRLAIRCLDLQTSGYATAAREARATLLPFGVLTELLTGRGVLRAAPIHYDHAFEQSLEEIARLLTAESEAKGRKRSSWK